MIFWGWGGFLLLASRKSWSRRQCDKKNRDDNEQPLFHPLRLNRTEEEYE